jgi:hypothetical protein
MNSGWQTFYVVEVVGSAVQHVSSNPGPGRAQPGLTNCRTLVYAVTVQLGAAWLASTPVKAFG